MKSMPAVGRPIQDAIKFDRMTIEPVLVNDVQMFRVFGWFEERKLLIDSFDSFEFAHQCYPEACNPERKTNGER